MAATFPGAVVTDAILGLSANGAANVLNGAINNSVTTIVVLDTTSFAASGYITIDSEIISYTSKNSTQFLGCTRGVDSSAAASHLNSAPVNGYIVSAHVRNLQLEVEAIEADINARFGIGASSNAITVPAAVRMGLGGVASANDPLEIRGATSSAFRGQLSLYDSTATTTGVGGQLVLGGIDSPGHYTEWASIQVQKANVTVSNEDANLIFRTRSNSNGMLMGLTIDSAQDVYTVGWTDYSGTSTIVGWVTLTSQKIFYKKIGKTVFVSWMLEGTSNSTTTSFTLPFARSTDTGFSIYGSIPAEDNGAVISSAVSHLASGASLIDFFKDITSAAWTSSGGKRIYGQMFYQTA